MVPDTMRACRGPGSAALVVLVVMLLQQAAHGQGLLAPPEQLAAGELAMARLFQSFEEALSFAPSVTGGRGRPGRSGTGGTTNPFSTADKLAQLQQAAYYIAGAPDAYPTCRSKDGRGWDPSRSYRRPDCNNFVPAARDQRVCSTCVSTAVAAALQMAAASTVQEPVERWRVNAASLHYCSKALVGFRTCPIGWDIAEALGTVLDAQPTIVRPDLCLRSVPELNSAAGEVGVVSWADVCGRANQAMQKCRRTNSTSTGHFLTCTYKPLVTFHDIQRHVRRHGAVVSRILIPDDFEGQFATASGLLGEQAQPYRFNASATPKYGHAVAIVGYNNTARTWTILNSWGNSSSNPGRKGTTLDGTYHITMGLLGVGDQAYGVECEPAPGSQWIQQHDPHETRPWEVAKPVQMEPGADSQDLNATCYIHRLNMSNDSVSSLVDHFGLGMLDFVRDNVDVVPLQNVTYQFVGLLSEKELQDVLNTANSLLQPAGGIQPFVQCSHYDAAGKETMLKCTTDAVDCTRLGNGTVGCALRYSAYDLSALATGAKLRMCSLSTSAFYRAARLNDVKASQRRALRDILRALGKEDAAVPEDYCNWDVSPRLRVSNCANGTWVTSITVQDPQANAATKTSLTMMMSDALLQPLLRLERLERLELFWLDGPLPPQLGALGSIKYIYVDYFCTWGTLPANWLDGWASIDFVTVGPRGGTRTPQFAGQACGISGSVPERWSSAAGSGSLRDLRIINNLLTGELPPLTNMSSLTSLALLGNRFSGTLPRSWPRDLRSVEGVSLQDNPYLVGLVPREWSSFQDDSPTGRIHFMNISITGLGGCLPLTFRGLKGILSYRGTNITGFCSLTAEQQVMEEASQAAAMSTTFRKVFADKEGGSAVASAARYFGNPSGWYADMLNWAGDGNVDKRREMSFVESLLGAKVTVGLEWDKAQGVVHVTYVHATDVLLDLSHVGHFVSKLPMLEELHIHKASAKHFWSNELPGDLPQHAGERLEILEISDSDVGGTLPATWGEWKTLRELELAHGTPWLASQILTGTLPPEWGQMESLQRLNLWGIYITGTLPPEWKGMRSLSTDPTTVSLELGYKWWLVGTLPPEWGDSGSRMPDGATFSFWDTSLTGTIPPSYKRFGRVDVKSTRVTGCVPPGVNALSSLPPCPDGERQAVEQLRSMLAAAFGSTSILEGWLTPAEDPGPYCRNKTGIQCDADSHVTTVDLPALGLELAPAAMLNTTRLFAILGELPYLQILNVSGMRLAGPLPTLPATLADGSTSLGKLRTLDLSGNPKVMGPLPPSWQAFQDLQVLDVSGCSGITGSLPEEWSALPRLQVLRAASSGIGGQLPASWQALQELQVLDVSGCRGITGSLPEDWAALPSLQVLRAANTSITGHLPPLYGLLESLQELDVSNARLSGPPVPRAWLNVSDMEAAVAASGLPSAQALLAAKAAAVGAVTTDATRQAETRPSASGDWSGVLLARLKVLRLANNQFSGTLNSTISKLHTMHVLDLSTTGDQGNITGVLPVEFASMSTLQELSLSGQRLSGGLPVQWSALSKLSKLGLARNQLSGPLPSTWTRMKKLRKLDLSGNAGLSGQVPSSWLQLNWCSKVLLGGTRVTGC